MSDTNSPKRKVPIWVWIVAGVLALVVIGSIAGGGEESDSPVDEASQEMASEPQDQSAEADSQSSSEVDTEPAAPLSPSEAFCSDLDAGLSIFQIYESGLDGGSYDSIEEFADLAYGFAAISCPEALESDEALRGFLEEWGINPDA